MTTDLDYKEVRFDIYCNTCKHRDKYATDEPCATCLEEPVNLHSLIPVNWKRDKMTVNRAYDILYNYTRGERISIYDRDIINIVGEDIFKALKDRGYLEKCGSAFGKDQYMLVERE